MDNETCSTLQTQKRCFSHNESDSQYNMSKSGSNFCDNTDSPSEASTESLRRRLNKLIGCGTNSQANSLTLEENEKKRASRKGTRRCGEDEDNASNKGNKRIRSPVHESKEENKQMEWISHETDCDLQYVKCLLNNLLGSLRQRVHLVVEAVKKKSPHVTTQNVESLRKMIADLQLFLRCLNRSSVSKQQIIEVCEQVKFMKKKLAVPKSNDRPNSSNSNKLGDSEVYRELSSLDSLLKQTMDNLCKDKGNEKKKTDKAGVDGNACCEKSHYKQDKQNSSQGSNKSVLCNLNDKEQELVHCLAKCISKYSEVLDNSKTSQKKSEDCKKKKKEAKETINLTEMLCRFQCEPSKVPRPCCKQESPFVEVEDEKSSISSDGVEMSTLSKDSADKDLWCCCKFECVCPPGSNSQEDKAPSWSENSGNTSQSHESQRCRNNDNHKTGFPGKSGDKGRNKNNPCKKSSNGNRPCKPCIKPHEKDNKSSNTDGDLIVVEFPGKCPPSMRLYVNDGEEFHLELPNFCSSCPEEKPVQLPPGCYSRLKIVTDCHEYIVQLNRRPAADEFTDPGDKYPHIYENNPQKEDAKPLSFTYPPVSRCSRDHKPCSVEKKKSPMNHYDRQGDCPSPNPPASSHHSFPANNHRGSFPPGNQSITCNYTCCNYTSSGQSQQESGKKDCCLMKYLCGDSSSNWKPQKPDVQGPCGASPKSYDSSTMESLSSQKNHCSDHHQDIGRKASEEIIENLEKKIEKILTQMAQLQTQSQLREETLQKVLTSLPKVDRVEKLVEKLINKKETVMLTSATETESEVNMCMRGGPEKQSTKGHHPGWCRDPSPCSSKRKKMEDKISASEETISEAPTSSKSKDHEEMKRKLEEIFSLLVNLVNSNNRKDTQKTRQMPETESCCESDDGSRMADMSDYQHISPEMYEMYELKSGMENNINLCRIDKNNAMRSQGNAAIPFSSLDQTHMTPVESSESDIDLYGMCNAPSRTGGSNKMGILAPVPPVASKEAFLTVVLSENELKDAIRLGKSIKKNSKKPTVAITGMNVSTGAMCMLGSVFDRVIRTKCHDPNDKTYLIITCWDLTQYKKCLLLSPNCMIVHECRKLFQQRELAVATPKLNASVWEQFAIVLEPNIRTAQRLRGFVSGSEKKMTFPQMLRRYFKNITDLNLE